MRILKGLLLFLAIVVVALVGVALLLPNSAHVERSVTINRPASEVFAVVNSFRRFNDWSPWFAKDPQAKQTFAGPAAGVGAKMSWAGNKDVGSGSQEIVESKPNELVRSTLDFGDMGKAVGFFRLTSAGSGTQVTWGFDTGFEGQLLISRFFGLMLDSMVGKDYEVGLVKLKSLVEGFPAADITGFVGDIVTLAPQKIYFVSAASATDSASAASALSQAYGQLMQFTQANGIVEQGPPLTITTSYDQSAWKFDAALAVDRNDVAPTGEIKAASTFAGRAGQFTHTGPYDKIGDTVGKAYAWLAIQGFKPTDRLIEEYVSDPATTAPEQIQTRIKIPIE